MDHAFDPGATNLRIAGIDIAIIGMDSSSVTGAIYRFIPYNYIPGDELFFSVSAAAHSRSEHWLAS